MLSVAQEPELGLLIDYLSFPEGGLPIWESLLPHILHPLPSEAD